MLVPFRSCVSNMKHMFAGKLFIYRRHSSNSEWNRQKNTVPKSTILSNVFRCILNSNIDKNFAIHNHAKFDYLSNDITVRLIWTTRSSHYKKCIDASWLLPWLHPNKKLKYILPFSLTNLITKEYKNLMRDNGLK